MIKYTNLQMAIEKSDGLDQYLNVVILGLNIALFIISSKIISPVNPLAYQLPCQKGQSPAFYLLYSMICISSSVKTAIVKLPLAGRTVTSYFP